MATNEGSGTPTAADFYAANRGGGLFSELINQRVGSYLAVAAMRLGLAPTTLTLVNLVLGVGTSVAVALAGVPAWPMALLALVLWQLAYSFDCADGQLARVTGRASAAGARADLLSDVAIQIGFVTAISSAAAATRPALVPTWFVAVFAGTWLVNLVAAAMAAGPSAASLLPSRSMAIRLVKLLRDYGAMLTACGLVLALKPDWLPWLMAGFCVTNGGFLVLSIVVASSVSASGSRRG